MSLSFHLTASLENFLFELLAVYIHVYLVWNVMGTVCSLHSSFRKLSFRIIGSWI